MVYSTKKRWRGQVMAAAMTLVCSLVCSLVHAQAVSSAQEAWVLGSWVNLRSAPGVTGAVKAQLTTNTPVKVNARQGDWCAVRVESTGAEGHVLCSLLGNAPLTLAAAADQPGRAFWIAPSVRRLMAYGALLRTGPAYNRMFGKLQSEEKATIAPLPEFDAAKRLMAAGVITQVDAEINRGEPVAPESMEFFSLLKPASIKPSMFKAHGDIVLRSEGSADSLAAVAQSKVSVNVTAPPVGYINRHEGPELSGITGFGDVGEIELRFAPAILVYSLLPNGLVGGAHLSKYIPASRPEYGAWCGMTYLDGGIGFPTNSSSESLTMQPAAGFPSVPDSMLLMASFVTAKPLLRKKLSIKSRMARVPNLQKPQDPAEAQDRPLPMAIPKVVLHEIDFDGDGVADMLAWDAPSIGGITGGFNLRRAWYLNIGGQWYRAGVMDDQECT